MQCSQMQIGREKRTARCARNTMLYDLKQMRRDEGCGILGVQIWGRSGYFIRYYIFADTWTARRRLQMWKRQYCLDQRRKRDDKDPVMQALKQICIRNRHQEQTHDQSSCQLCYTLQLSSQKNLSCLEQKSSP